MIDSVIHIYDALLKRWNKEAVNSKMTPVPAENVTTAPGPAANIAGNVFLSNMVTTTATTRLALENFAASMSLAIENLQDQF